MNRTDAPNSTNGNRAPSPRTSNVQRPTSNAEWQRVLPHSIDAEKGVLGSILSSPRRALDECGGKILAEHFYSPPHATIFEALLKMDEQKKAIDIITVGAFLKDEGKLDEVGGAVAVTALFTFVPLWQEIGSYVGIVREMFVRREMIRICTGLVQKAFDPEGTETQAVLDEAQGELTTLTLDRAMESPLVAVRETVPEVLEEIENAYEHRGRVQGLETGFVDLDRMTSGLHPGEMIVIGARPSMGKTALAMNIAEHVAFDRSDGKWDYKGVPVAIFSLETSRNRLVRRQIASRARVSIQKMRDGFFAERDFPALTGAAARLMSAPIYIDDTPGLRLHEFKARLRWAVAKLGVRLGVVDYLQLMKNPSKRAEFSRVLEVTEISAGVKQVGRELNIPIIVLVQLNRDAEKHESGRPRMMHLRECGAIEQDADLIGLLYRPEVYAEDDALKRELEGQAELIIAKQKDGPVGTIYLTFLKEFTRFEDRAVLVGGEEVARPLYSSKKELRQWVD